MAALENDIAAEQLTVPASRIGCLVGKLGAAHLAGKGLLADAQCMMSGTPTSEGQPRLKEPVTTDRRVYK